MKFNKEQLDALIAMPDDKLWSEIVRMAEGYGFSMPKETPPHAELERLRDTVRGSKINAGEAMRLLNNYRKKH